MKVVRIEKDGLPTDPGEWLAGVISPAAHKDNIIAGLEDAVESVGVAMKAGYDLNDLRSRLQSILNEAQELELVD